MEIDRNMIDQALENAGLEQGALYENYSGRMMYGKECIGITGSAADATRFIMGLEMLKEDEADEVIECMLADQRTDSMGMNTITYWPALTLG